jgi:hypothetical protein
MDSSTTHNNYVSQTIYRSIVDQDRSVCPIRQTRIQDGERYMLCNGCQNCYNEYDIIQWFVIQNGENRERTCPICRQTWSDYNVYIPPFPPLRKVEPKFNEN